MAILRINGKQVDVDIENELRQYSWDRERWTSDKLIACSPFRQDNSPSFFVNLESGGWGDSGGIGEYANGNLMSLIGYLRGTSPYEAGEYLIDKYGALYDITGDSEGDVTLRVATPKISTKTQFTKEISGEHVIQAVSPYVTTRGISDDVQRKFAIGYGEGHRGFTAIPWYTVDGRLANVKYRSTSDKRFFYEANATSVNTLVYGIDAARGNVEVVIVEGEIDALSWWTAGIPAVALGGAHINDIQSEMIAREGFKRIYLGGDNDKQGRKLDKLLTDKLGKYAEIYEIDYGEYKDANEALKAVGTNELYRMVKHSNEVYRLKRFHY